MGEGGMGSRVLMEVMGGMGRELERRWRFCRMGRRLGLGGGGGIVVCLHFSFLIFAGFIVKWAWLLRLLEGWTKYAQDLVGKES